MSDFVSQSFELFIIDMFNYRHIVQFRKVLTAKNKDISGFDQSISAGSAGTVSEPEKKHVTFLPGFPFLQIEGK